MARFAAAAVLVLLAFCATSEARKLLQPTLSTIINLPNDLLSSASNAATSAAIQAAAAGDAAVSSVMRTANLATGVVSAGSGSSPMANNNDLRAGAATRSTQTAISNSAGGQTSASRATAVGGLGGAVQQTQSMVSTQPNAVPLGSNYAGDCVNCGN